VTSLRAAHETSETGIRASTEGRESRGMPPTPGQKALQNVEDRLRGGVMNLMLVSAIAAVEGRRRRADRPRRAATGYEYRRKSGDRALNAWS
jgi:hypothetical protein